MTGYRVYRNDNAVASVGADVNAYTDASSGPATSYRVSAINAVGEGPKSPAVLPSVPASGCTLPGIMVAEDTIDTVPNAPPQPQVDVKTTHVAEPYGDGPAGCISQCRPPAARRLRTASGTSSGSEPRRMPATIAITSR